MKKYIYLFLFIFCLPLVSTSQNATEAIASFKPILKSVDDFFSASPIALNSEDYTLSPSGKRYYLLKFEKLDIAYDIKKTDSLISPFTAYISLRLKASSNAIYGDLKYHYYDKYAIQFVTSETKWGFQKAEVAIKKKVFASCSIIEKLELHLNEARWERCLGEAKLLYAYQDNKWAFKDVILDGSTGIRDSDAARVLRETILSNADWVKYIRPKK